MEEKIAEQAKLSERVVLEDGFGDIKRVAGVDSAYLGERVVSGVVLMEHGQVVEEVHAWKEFALPYKPTFLMFTEGPSMVEAVKKLSAKPDLLFVDGHGIAHPRGAGLACYVGVVTGIPTIGIAKELLVGEYTEPKREGESELLLLDEKPIGWVVKTREGKRSIFVSPGNKVSVGSSLELALKFVEDGKLPEPLELAHRYANRVREHVKAKR